MKLTQLVGKSGMFYGQVVYRSLFSVCGLYGSLHPNSWFCVPNAKDPFTRKFSNGFPVISPHGVRAIAFFLFGLRATLYLLPAHYAMWYITVHGADIGLDVFSPLVSVLGCLLGYILFLFVRKFLPTNIYDKGYILVFLIIIFSAFFNSVGLSRLHFSLYDFEHLLSYFWGDVFGGLIFLVLAMYIWRILKNTKFD